MKGKLGIVTLDGECMFRLKFEKFSALVIQYLHVIVASVVEEFCIHEWWSRFY